MTNYLDSALFRHISVSSALRVIPLSLLSTDPKTSIPLILRKKTLKGRQLFCLMCCKEPMTDECSSLYTCFVPLRYLKQLMYALIESVIHRLLFVVHLDVKQHQCSQMFFAQRNIFSIANHSRAVDKSVFFLNLRNLLYHKDRTLILLLQNN